MTTSRPSLSLSFHNFWRHFVPQTSFFFRALQQSFDVTLAPIGRDLQISSVFGNEQLPVVDGIRPLRVWWTGEEKVPQSQIFDLYFGFRPKIAILGRRWHRFPLWITDIDWWDEKSPRHYSNLLAPPVPAKRSRFCNFIFSSEPSIRTEFFFRLNEARPVDSVGRLLNNREWRPPDRAGKLAVLRDSTFTIAFENQMSPGYVTEKLLEPLLVGSIPIYWGAAEAKDDFNREAFIHAEDFDDFDSLIKRILRIANSPDEIAALSTAPRLKNARFPYEHTPAFFVDRIREALSAPKTRGLPPGWDKPWRRPGAFKTLEARLRRWRRS